MSADVVSGGVGSAGVPVARARTLLAGFVAGYHPECWSGPDTARLVEDLAGISRLVDAATTLAAGRVAATNGWKLGGHASPEEWLASTTGTSSGAAGDRLRTAEQLDGLDATVQALREGRLSGPQTGLVAAGAAADPSVESDLLSGAQVDSFRTLRDKSRAARAAARAGRIDTARIHASRSLRSWTADDGAVEGRFRLTPDRGAQVLAALERFTDETFLDARAAGVPDRPEAYRADALVAMAAAAVDSLEVPGADATGSSPVRTGAGRGGVVVHVRIDRAALLRGWTEPGETCEIDGIGPVPVTVARRLAGDATLWAVLHDGGRILDVCSAGRSLPARLKVALIERDRCCVVPGCGRTRRLEIHHLVPYAQGGATRLINLARLCAWHHDQVTHRGARLSGAWPQFDWTPPPIGPDGEEGGPGPFDDPPPDADPADWPGLDRTPVVPRARSGATPPPHPPPELFDPGAADIAAGASATTDTV